MKKWEVPVIESVAIENTADTILSGDIEDGLYVYDKAYFVS